MGTAQVLLGLLAAGPRHGYELKHDYDQRFPQARPLAYGQVYATLARFARDGLIEVTEVAAGAGPERTVYKLTPEGEHKLAGWLAEVEPPAPHLSADLVAKVVVGLVAGGDVRAYLRAQRVAQLARMRELTAAKNDPAATSADVVAADYALAHLDADLRWMETTTARLEELTKEVQP